MNAFERCPLTRDESAILEEITSAAGGVGLMTKKQVLTESQHNSLRPLKTKGYVMMTVAKYLVVYPAAAVN